MSLNELINPVVPLTLTTATTFELYTPTIATTSVTISSAAILGGLIVCNPGAPITLTTPTAVALFNAMPTGPDRIGAGIEVVFNNISANAVTIAAGTGVTITNIDPNPIAAHTTRTLLFILTAIATPAFTVYG